MTWAWRQDLRSAWRGLWRHRVSSLLIVAMLGLGIGGNAVAFSWIDAILLRPLPFDEPERLVSLDVAIPTWHRDFAAVHFTDFHGWRRHQSTFESMAVLQGRDFNLSGGERPVHVKGALASHDLFAVLALQPILGRLYDESEDQPGGADVVVLGHGFWQSHFGGREDVLGQATLLDGVPYAVIGVLPRRAGFPYDADLWVPLRADPARWQGHSLTGLGRLKRGVEPSAAQADLTAIQNRRRAAGKLTYDVVPLVKPLHERYLGQAKPYVLALWSVVAFVLAIACANITCLLLIHALARRRELGVRSALGAGRWVLLRQVLVEGLLLAVLGGFVGVGLAFWGLRALMVWIGDGLPFWAEPQLNVGVLAACGVLCLGGAILSATLPYVRVVGRPVLDLLGTATAASPDRGNRVLTRALVAGEMALALALLFGTALLLHSFFELRRVDPGFRDQGILTFNVHLPGGGDPQAAPRFFEQLRQALAELPGVEAAGAVSALPLSGPSGAFLYAEGSALEPSGAEQGSEAASPAVLHRTVSVGYFKTMDIRLLQGRVFDERDNAPSAAPVLVVNQSFAALNWPDQDPVGRRVKYGSHRSRGDWMTVVGVVGDVLHDGLDREARPGVYVPMATHPGNEMSFVVHSTVDPEHLVGPVQALIQRMDAQLPISRVRTMESLLDDSLSALRLVGTLAAVFMAIALVLALGGIYGSVSYSVSRRTRELAIRMAMGAGPGAGGGAGAEILRPFSHGRRDRGRGHFPLDLPRIAGLSLRRRGRRAMDSGHELHGASPGCPPGRCGARLACL